LFDVPLVTFGSLDRIIWNLVVSAGDGKTLVLQFMESEWYNLSLLLRY